VRYADWASAFEVPVTVQSGVFRALLFALPATLWTGQAAQTPPAAPPAAQTPQTPPVFRGGTVLVPVDVRVLDRNGKPVTDLKQSEFTILENGVRQEIRHFSTQALAADPPAAAAPLVRATTATSPAELGPQTHRTFLIVLGRGRLQPVTKALDGMVHLIRERLLPQDYVAVLAFNRATDFTTDHEKIAGVLDRYLKQHEKIEALMAQRFSGLAAAYGGLEIPKSLQASIDAIFNGPNAPGIRTVPDAQVANATRVGTDQRQVANALMTNEIRAATESTLLTDPVDGTNGVEMSFDEYVETNAGTMQDLTKIYAGISYLRYLDGEKHLLFVTERGLLLPRAEDDKGVAAMAADARVAIDILHTGGTPAPVMGRGARGGMAPSGAMAGDWRQQTSRTVAQMTGGEFTSLTTGKAFVDRLDQATRFSYLLGYYPANARLDGQFRRLQIRVNRPGLTGLTIEYRRGYFAQQQIGPLDRARVLTYSRVSAAANSAQVIPDIGLTLTASNVAAGDGTPAVQIVVQIRPEHLGFVEKDGRKKGAIDIAVFCADDKEHLLGESWNTVDLEMTPEAFAKFQTSGLRYTGTVPVKSAARLIKVIVYDAAADVLGSAVFRIEPPKVKK
jgi:VWFA-related protein